MARKSLRDMGGIAKTIANSSPQSAVKSVQSTAPALGALQGSLSAIRELDPTLVDDWGPKDRLDEFTAVNSDDEVDGFETLLSSIREDGQQVPILVRKSSVAEGRYEVIYGRRRLRACMQLGIKVRANVQDLDDKTALLAKGLENAARRNLSFYEKARFAAVIQAAGHDTQMVRKVLGLSKSGVSHLTKVTENIPDDVGDKIGAAPTSGRPKWTALADAFLTKKLTSSEALNALSKFDTDCSSDERLDQILSYVASRGTRSSLARVNSPVEGVTIKSGPGSIAVSVKRQGESAAFAAWLDRELENIIKRSFQEFTAVNSEDDTRKSRKEDAK